MPTNYSNPAHDARIDENTQALPDNTLLHKVGAALEAVKTHTNAAVLALTISLGGAAHAEESKNTTNIIFTSSANGVSSDTQGEIDAPLTAVQIQERINEINTSIAEVEAKESKTGADRKQAYLLKKELIELENQKQAAENATQAEQVAVIEAENRKQDVQADTISNYDEALENLEKVTDAVKG